MALAGASRHYIVFVHRESREHQPAWCAVLLADTATHFYIQASEKLNTVRPKKHLGQHFLADPNIARNIVGALRLPDGVAQVLEIGPGMGVLTQYLL